MLLDSKQPDGASLRVHLQRAAAVGKVDPLLEAVPLPYFLQILWDTFLLLNKKRTHGMGVNPISSMEIESWCRLHRIDLLPWEVETIEAVDDVVMSAWVREKKQTESKT